MNHIRTTRAKNMSQELVLAGVSLLLLIYLKIEIKEIKVDGESENTCSHLLDATRQVNGMGFVVFLRMTPKHFENLLQVVAPMVFKENTNKKV